ncbi:MAG TPA: glycosyltransferase [Streptosporangiaceae bacterium]|jgi:1,2-diacylglycerol 3-beta-galactosyltransferase|nr:glycosyltransferase [Streptosporangiaceae bacterium]
MSTTDYATELFHDRGGWRAPYACEPPRSWNRPRLPLLFLIADTGGGHRSAARAVAQALERGYPGRFAPVLCDPLGGPGSARLLRWVAGLYGPVIRRAPWLWGAAYHLCDSRPAAALLARTLLRLAHGPAADAARAHRPAGIVSFHPLTGTAAVAARDRGAAGAPVVTVVTDLARMHAAWGHARADLLVAPPTALRDSQHDGQHGRRQVLAATTGLPVTRDYWGGPLRRGERMVLRRALGLSEDRFLVLLAGGGEGSGGLGRRAAAILRRYPDVEVVALCGRNQRLKRRMDRLAARSGGRLTVTGFTRHLADWLRSCDLVVTKAGPGTIAEATCCGAPLLLTSHLPGQEAGNPEVVTRAGAGRRARGVRRMLAEIGSIRADAAAAQDMRRASAALGRPGAAAEIADLIASLVLTSPAATASPARHGRQGSSAPTMSPATATADTPAPTPPAPRLGPRVLRSRPSVPSPSLSTGAGRC